MLDAVLLTLASTAGTRLVSAMIDDGWSGVKAKVARLLGGGDPAEEQRQANRLERSRQELVPPDDASAAADASPSEGVRAPGEVELARRQERLAQAWATRFEDALAENPALAANLEQLVAELGGATPNVAGSVQVNATASGQAQQAVQGQGQQTNTFGPPR